MNVEAVRDDGALLVTAGGDAAVLLTRDGTYVTSVGAALARGDWRDPNGETVPTTERRRVRELLTDANHAVVTPSGSAMIQVATTVEVRNEEVTRRATRVRELRERVSRAEGPDGEGEPHRRDDRAGAE